MSLDLKRVGKAIPDAGFAQTHCFDRALLALRSGRVRTEGIVTNTVPLERFGDALAAVASSVSVKAAVTPR